MSVPLSLSLLPSHKAAFDLHFCQGNWSIWLLPITTQCLFPPCLPYPAIPPILCSLQSPFSDLPRSVPHFHPDKTSRSCRKLLHLGSRVHLWRNGSVLAAHGIPLDSQLFTRPLIYALLKRPHATEQVIVHVVKKGRGHSLSL